MLRYQKKAAKRNFAAQNRAPDNQSDWKLWRSDASRLISSVATDVKTRSRLTLAAGATGTGTSRTWIPTRRGKNGPPAILGMIQMIDPEEAVIVCLIYTSYAGGMSYLRIAKMLNERGVPPPQSPRKKSEPSWSKHSIQHILANDRYRGNLTYGRSTEVRNPETGKKERRDRPVSQWDTRKAPELRIISDDLWSEVEKLHIRKSRTLGVKRSGGMGRTVRSRSYLLSGLLKCGVCGGFMTISGMKPARYGCSTRLHRGACADKATIRQEDLERVFMHALGEKLRSEDLREELIQSLFERLRSMKGERLDAENSAEVQRKELEASRKTQLNYQENLVQAVREGGGSRALLTDLTQVEARIARIEEILATSVKTPAREIRLEEVREFVNRQAHSFEELLLGTPESVKNELQKRIEMVILTPTVDERGPVYKVTGDVDLFSVPEVAL